MYQRTWSQTHHRQTHNQANMIHSMIESIANSRANDAIKKSIRNVQNRICQTHCRVILIRPTKVTIEVRDAIIKRATGKRDLSNCAKG